MPIKLRDIANAKVPRTEKEWAAAEREYNRECEEYRRYEAAVEAYKGQKALLTWEGIPLSRQRLMIEQQMSEARKAMEELLLFWDEPAP